MTEFRVLGPLEVVEDRRPVALPGPKPRALLALLLLDANRVVPTDRLVDGLWEDDPPETAAKTIQVYVSQLRKALGAERIATHPRGYSVVVGDDELDSARFERLVGEGRFEEALALWRGPALADFADTRFGREAAGRLDQLRVAAEEERIDAELALGGHGAAIPELERLVAAHPLRERLRAQLMLALYRSGRQADALELYRRTRAELVEGLGIDPGPDLQELERRILAQDPALAAPSRLDRRRADEPQAAARDPILAGLAALLVAAAVVALVITAVDHRKQAPSREVGGFVIKVENLLRQSSAGRASISSTIGAALDCSVSPARAARQITSAERNRQSVLQQIAALRVPDDDESVRLASLFQRALGASIDADWRYRDWLQELRRCPRGATAPAGVTAADARATALKARFVQAYNPLAIRYGRDTWNATDF